MPAAIRVLVVDDEDNIAFLVASALRLEGLETRSAATGREAVAAVEEWAPDLVVLDVMLPDLDGFEVLRRLRSSGHRQPVVFLTARDATDDRVRGLTVGGDDYLVKPFAIEELVARVHAVLRRSGRGTDRGVFRVGDLVLDDEAHAVTRGGRPITLTPTEYHLLRFLMASAGRVMSRAQILDHVWDYDFGGESSVVESYVSYLRRKVDAEGPPLIHTVRGFGYTIRAEPEP
ncbi:MAG TPA: response regulator transcription factor [Microthrixaceae bacterium]|jgi:two-component system OmpR family response regulator|nr:response regulator transcription factor [Microthrixaceae bacterium]